MNSRSVVFAFGMLLGCQAEADPAPAGSGTDGTSTGAGTEPVDDTAGGVGDSTTPTGSPASTGGGSTGSGGSAAETGQDESTDGTDSEDAGASLDGYSDEFDDPTASEARWSFRHEIEGEDAQFAEFTFGSPEDDRARLVPTRGGWYGTFKGPFVFQTVEGNFMMEAHVVAHLRGDEGVPPAQPYNSAGLLIRNPSGSPDGENWVLQHLGMHDPEGDGVGVERKITRNSNSELALTPNDFRGRIRICRVGGQVMLTRQLDDEPTLTVSAEYELELEDEVQAGFSLTAWNSRTNKPDLSFDGDVVGVWDYVRYTRINDISACLED
ncbi:MAG: hypothetical protein AAGA54_33225 [Myxococcota bacterium]